MAKSLISKRRKDVYDPDTGECYTIEEITTHRIKSKEDHFIMMYLQDTTLLLSITHLSDHKLLIKLMEMCDYNSGRVLLTSSIRAKICDATGISKSNLSSNINRLKGLGLISGEKGEYYLNPKLFWKGDRKERSERINDL